MSKWWRTCTYADVHRLILEVLHLRLTLREIGELTSDAMRMIAYLERADELKYAAPLRRLALKVDKEIMRAGRMGNPRVHIAPFSDKWRAREATKCRLRDVPSEPDPGSDKATKLPEFQRLTWAELRDAWSAIPYKKNRPLTLEQRFVLEIVHIRRTMRLMEKAVSAAELELKKSGYPDSFGLDQLRRMVECIRDG
ncbi:hypothetical protein FEP07_05607 [Burkholderia multivorans]|nr:hypothetical protein [Burkholderia multivorans]MDR9266346.1 hypothetical protein [Burkholderia multivorans]MDR9288262.1 hypothetical protein [Burkholderia multivorans]MDR9290059.1 hypothetical protein [Burkholderia multivorans]MDR9312760.1 hypothetical protein [Burkholderia multivorans]